MSERGRDLHVRYSAQPERCFVARKLPHITILFWVLKILAVTLGETAGDLLGITLQTGYVTTGLILLVFLISVAVWQVRARRYWSALFWTVIFATSAVGTEISDLINRGPGHASAQGGIGYAWGALILTIILAIVFLIWWRTGQTYDVESVASRQGEILFWIAVTVSNTLGASSGDWLAHDTGLGFRSAFLLLAGMMMLIVAAHFGTRINTMVLFWLAFILTRPLGAAGGDYLTKPTDEGGLGLGTMWGSAVLLGLLAVFISYESIRLRRHPLEPLQAPVHRRTGVPQHPNGELIVQRS